MTTITEEWVAVEGFLGYSVSPQGHVRKNATGRVLETRLNQYGVPYVGLMRGWKQHSRSLPRLVASAFIPQPNDVFDTPINLNGVRSDCRVENLAWRPRWYAVLYNNQFIDRYDNPIHSPMRETETGEEFSDSLSAAAYFGLLEREVVLSILNNTLTFPSYLQFELSE